MRSLMGVARGKPHKLLPWTSSWRLLKTLGMSWSGRIYPCIAPSAVEWTQDIGQNARGALVCGRSELVQSDNMAMSAMMAVLKVDHDCQYTLSRVIDEA
jgi:hypothetical protein